VGLRDADGRAEVANRLRSVAAAANAGQSWHARIVPPADVLFLYQLQQLAFAQQRVGQVQAVEFDLLSRENTELLDKPVVERAMVFELERAHGMRHTLQ